MPSYDARLIVFESVGGAWPVFVDGAVFTQSYDLIAAYSDLPTQHERLALSTLYHTSVPSHSPLLLPPGELLPGSHPADEDEPNLLLVPGLPVFASLRPPGGSVPAQ